MNPKLPYFSLLRRLQSCVFCGLALSQPRPRDDAARKGAADIVFTNGKIYTVNRKTPFAEAVAVKDGKFMEVGSAQDIKRFVGERTRVVDLGGAFAMPGFIDAHIHPAQPYLHEEARCSALPETFNERPNSRSSRRIPQEQS